MSASLSAERDRIQKQVEELEQILSATNTELELLSSETGDESDDDDSEEEGIQCAAGLLAQREKIKKEIQNLENVLGPQSPVCLSDDDDDDEDEDEDEDDDVSSSESELGLSLSAESCLQMNLVYQQVLQETLDQLETLLTHNHRLQKELLSQLSGPIKETSREQPAPSSFQQPISMYLGRFLKPYFKDKLTGLGPPANQETKEKASRLTGCLDDKKLRMKRWGSWQKTLLINSIAKDSLRRLIQPKLSRVDYLSQKLSSASETDREQLRQQINSLEKEIDLIRAKKEEELLGDQYDEHDWQKISNIDFEGTRDAEDIRSFWQNYLHPSINKTAWSKEEVQQLKEVSKRHEERHWETIAAELGTGRTAFLCLQTFQRFASESLKRGSWTPDEDNLLRELVDKLRIGNFIPYTQMSYFIEGRDPAQLIYRWNQVLDPSLRKGLWTKEEDQLLLKAVSCYGEKNWWKIRLEVPGRTDSSCRDRYYDCLKAGTKRGPFDQQEVELLLQLVEKHGVGRWAKIAAEIPNRYDAQCLREWRKLSRSAAAPSQKNKRKKKTSKSRGQQPKKRTTKTKAAGTAKKKIRRRLMMLKEEEEEEEESSEEEGMVVEYMDSDEEEKKKKKMKKKKVVEVEKEYTFPPMQEWIPVEKAQAPFTFLSFRPVELPSSGVAQSRVRSTIVGQFGRSVIIGPAPRELRSGERHSNSTMMMVSPDQLRAHLRSLGHKFKTRTSGRRGRTKIDNQNPLGRVMDKGLYYELQATVTPWIGNLLIPPKHKVIGADVLRDRGEQTQLHSTPIFLLLLQTLNVDAVGCKEMIEQRRNKVVLMAPPPCPRSAHPNTIAGILQQKRAMKEELQEFDLQHNVILKQLQELQQREQQRRNQQLLRQQQPQPPPHPPPRPYTPSQNCPPILLQMPPNMRPLMSPMSFPQAVFIPHPVTQPHAPFIQPPTALNTSPLAPHGPPSVGVNSSPLPLHPAPYSVPPVSEVSKPLNTMSTSSASLQQEAPPSTQNLIVASPASSDRHVSVGFTPPSNHAPPSTSSSPVTCPRKSRPAPRPGSVTSSSPKGRGQKVTVCSSQSGGGLGGAGDGVGGACAGVAGAGESAIKEGKRSRTSSQKAKALQEATKAKAEAKKKAASSPRKKTQIQTVNPAPPQTLVPPPTIIHAPPQTVVPVPPQTWVPPQTIVPVPPQTVVHTPPQTVVSDPPKTLVPPQTIVPVPPQTIVSDPPQTVVPGPPQTLVPPQTVVPVPPQTVVSDPPQTVVPVPPQTIVLVPPQTVVSDPPQTVVSDPPQTVVPVPPQTIIPVPPQTLVPPQTIVLVPPQTVVSDPPQTVVSDPPQTVVPGPPQTVVPDPPQQVCTVPIQLIPQTPPSSLTPPPTAPQRPPPARVVPCPLTTATPPSAPPLRLNVPPVAVNPSPLPLNATPACSDRTVSSSQGVGGTDTGVILDGKRVRTQTPKARAFQEAKAEANKKRSSSSPRKKRCRKSRSKEDVVAQNQPMTPLPGFCLLPGQCMWVMTPSGRVPLAAPPPGTQQVLAPSAPLPAPPRNNLKHQPATRSQLTNGKLQLIAPHTPAPGPVPTSLPVLNQPSPFAAPPTCASKPLPPGFILQPISNPDSSPQPPQKIFLPYKGTVRPDPAAPPPLRREPLQFDPSLMFLESQKAVCDWLSGRRGVVVPGAGMALPYLPPFVSSLSTLSTLLRAKDSLTKSSLQLLSQGSEPRHPTTSPKPDSSTETTSSPPPDLPDSTSDLRPAQDTEAPSVSSVLPQEEEEAELVAVVRQLVAERFSGNPAYQLLKARFLSCFTVPALLATMQPNRGRAVACPANEEEEDNQEEEEDDNDDDDEEVTELKKMKERGRQRRAERSVLLCDRPGAPANHFSGIITSTPGPDRTGSDQ